MPKIPNITPSIDELDFVEREELRRSRPSIVEKLYPLARPSKIVIDDVYEEATGYDDNLYDHTYQ